MTQTVGAKELEAEESRRRNRTEAMLQSLMRPCLKLSDGIEGTMRPVRQRSRLKTCTRCNEEGLSAVNGQDRKIEAAWVLPARPRLDYLKPCRGSGGLAPIFHVLTLSLHVPM